MDVGGANHGKAYGATAAANLKQASKLNKNLEKEVKEWISAVTKKPIDGELNDVLHDGVILCDLMNSLSPGSVKKVNTSRLAFKQMENIGNALAAAEKYGVPQADLFQTVDLYEDKDRTTVVVFFDSLGRTAQKQGYDGPVLGSAVKLADKHDSKWTEADLAKGMSTVGLQAGYAGGASQAGSLAPGTARQIVQNKK